MKNSNFVDSKPINFVSDLKFEFCREWRNFAEKRIEEEEDEEERIDEEEKRIEEEGFEGMEWEGWRGKGILQKEMEEAEWRENEP